MIRRQVVVPVAPGRLWEALTEPDQLAGWFGGRMEWDLRPGGAARFRGDDGTERVGRIETVRPGRHLRFVWWPAGDKHGASAAKGESAGDEVSEVSYLLEQLDEGTRLTIQERQVSSPSGAGSQAGPARQAHPTDTAMAWTAWDGRLAGAWAGLARSRLASTRS
jgi:uncharacterized protein YndB with AHSA1/START domain